ncbi:MAG TPA: RDD family protein [Solirubrobacteraceae bacterium]|nr:RDD family protein [Solirubrobacteraceae bacterium]
MGSVSEGGTVAVPGDVVAHPDLARLTHVLQAPQAALRARLNAVILDLVLVGIASQLLAPALAGRGDAAGRTVVFLALEFSYFFLYELRRGQTIGKRVFHVRVVTLDGSPATARQIALRNALRIFDALPLLYASGLISLWRTGPARRQRLGDVAARTTVVLEPGAPSLRTPGWMLPTLTALATVLSLAIVIPALSGASHQAPGAAIAAAGPGDQPQEGEWVASGRVVRSIGYSNALGTTASWRIAQGCLGGARCGLVLTDTASDGRVSSAPLTRTARAWIAVFPTHQFVCARAGGETIYWTQHTAFALRFTNAGRAAEAEELTYSQSPRCGYGTALRTWRATWAAAATG